MKQSLLDVLVCDHCGGAYTAQYNALACQQCGATVPMQAEVPLFTPLPAGIKPSDKLKRGPDVGTPWRRANWRFLEDRIAGLSPEAVILDVGAGRGDFAELFKERNYLALDVYPYPEVDLVCDLTQSNPFRPGSFDAILLMNVLEHIYDTHSLLASLAWTLKPGGVMLIAIPFMVKMHQLPLDYVRYTHFALDRLGKDHHLIVENIEGFYDPVSLFGEGLSTLKWSTLPALRGMRRYTGRAVLVGLEALTGALRRVLGPGRVQTPDQVRSYAPTGYHVVYRKELVNDI